MKNKIRNSLKQKDESKKEKNSKKSKWFCMTCGFPVLDDMLQFEKDSGHYVVPRSDVIVEGEDKQPNNSKEERSTAKILFDLAISKIKKLVISENNSDEVYGVVSIKSHTEVLNLSSARARHWLSYEYSENVDSTEIYGDDFFKKILHSIMAQAQINGTKKAKIYTRVAQTEDSFWYDLGTGDFQAIKITADNIRTVSLDENTPLFRRPQSMQPQVIPKKSGSSQALNQLCHLLHILPKDFVIFQAHLICMLLCNYPVPMIIFDGSAGSIKTTVTSAIKSIIDPSGKSKEDNVSAIAEKPDDVIVQLYNRYLSSFDNVSHIDEKTSDVLCRAITGSSNPKRKLYTDGEEAIHNFKSKIVLNGIIPTLEYPDLQTRILNYERIPLDDTNRITDKEFARVFGELLPYVLGQIFVILSKALKKYSDVEKTIKPKTRMADFEVWGEIISMTLGYKKREFLNRYYEKLQEENISSQEAYPIIGILQEIMKNKQTYEDSASNLYKELIMISEELGIDLKTKFIKFPKASNKLTKHLKLVNSFLKTSGLIVHTYYYTKSDGRFTKHASIVRIDKKPDQDKLDNFTKQPSPSSPSSPTTQRPQNHAQNEDKSSEGMGEGSHISSDESSPESKESRHKTDSSESSEDGEDTLAKLSESNNENLFVCSCGAGPFRYSAVGTGGMKIKTFHLQQGHDIIPYPKEKEHVDN